MDGDQCRAADLPYFLFEKKWYVSYIIFPCLRVNSARRLRFRTQKVLFYPALRWCLWSVILFFKLISMKSKTKKRVRLLSVRSVYSLSDRMDTTTELFFPCWPNWKFTTSPSVNLSGDLRIRCSTSANTDWRAAWNNGNSTENWIWRWKTVQSRRVAWPGHAFDLINI